VPRGVSPVAVYGYHTCLFSLAAPKLSCLTAYLSNGTAVPEVFESIRCEAYGPGGAAVIVDCRTDSRDRTIAQVREVVRAHGGYMGARGAVGYLFNEVGRLVFPPGTDATRLTRVAVQAGAEDVIAAGAPQRSLEVLTDPIDFETVRVALQAAGFVPISAQVTHRASITVPLQGEAAVAMLHMIEALKALNEVENVYTNVEIPDEVLARS
jgi:transcriptional/translational regulatory protein YebC/TACO1